MAATLPDALVPWALEVLGWNEDILTEPEVVAGDASNRRYFRLAFAERTYVLVHAPPATEKNAAFVHFAAVLARAGVRVPEVLATDMERGFLLLEDLGDELLLPVLTADNVDDFYTRAGRVLLQLARLEIETQDLTVYDAPLLDEELSRFIEWFVEGLLEHTLAPGEQSTWRAFAARIVDSALAQPQVLVHRDFHSRNIMLLRDESLAVIDFQDAVWGPVTYDLVSLLRDCYIRWPAGRVRGWALAHRDALVQRELLTPCSDEAFLRWFDWMGLQRHIKVLGNFSRLSIRDAKPGYLKDLPMVIDYILEILDLYASDEAEIANFRDWFRETLLPLARKKGWATPL